MSPKFPKLLTYYSKLKVFHYLYNVIDLMQRYSFGTVFATKLSVVKKKQWSKRVLSALYVGNGQKVKKRPLQLLFFAECIFDNLKK